MLIKHEVKIKFLSFNIQDCHNYKVQNINSYTFIQYYWTLLCIVTGFVVQFSLLFMAVTWFLHVFHLFLQLAFPIWSLQFFSSTKRLKLCILEICGAVIFSITLPAVVLSVSSYSYASFPPLLTVPSKELSLYTLMLPFTILLAVGINLMFLSFWKIYKVRNSCDIGMRDLPDVLYNMQKF